MAIQFYGYAKCSTCRKAQSLLDKRGLRYEVLDITERPPTQKDLKAMLAHLGGELRRLFNTSGQVYREMRLGAKLASMSQSDAIKLLAANGKLIKRPFLMIDGKPAAIGFNEKEWSALL